MDYLSRFNFGLATCVQIYLFWNFLMYVNGQNLAEFGFGTRNPNDKNLYGLRSEFVNNAKLGEKKSIVEPYHEVYSFKNSAGGIQRIHYAIDNLGVRANFHSSNVQYDPIIDSPHNIFGARLSTKSEIGNSGNLQSENSENYPSQTNNKNSNDITTKLSSNGPVLEQIRNEQLEYSPVVEGNPINYLSSPKLTEIDSRKFVQTKFSQQVSDKLENVDMVQKPYYTFYEESAPVDFLQQKSLRERSQSLKSPRKFQSPNFQVYPITTPASLITPEIFKPVIRDEDKALHFRNITTPFLIKSKEHEDVFHESELNSAININVANSFNSIDSSAPNFKTISEKDALPIRSSKLAPISYITLVKSPLSAIFDTSNKNGQYYHYAMNLGETPGVSSQFVSKIHSTGDGLYKILNQTNIDVYKIENEIVLASDNRTINSTLNETPKNNSKYDAESSYSTINKVIDISKSNLSLNLEIAELKDGTNGKNVISNITSEFILLNNSIGSKPLVFDNFNESASQKQIYLTTSPDLEIINYNEKNISTLNFFPDVSLSSYSDLFEINSTLPQYITTESPFLNTSTDSDMLNATDHIFSFLTKLLSEEHRNELEKSTTVLDSQIIHDNFETTTSLWNIEEPLEANNAFDFSTATKVSLGQLTNESIHVSLNQSFSDNKNVPENMKVIAKINNDIHQTATPFVVSENTPDIKTETTTLFPHTFTPKLKEPFDNNNQSKERKSRIIENNNTSNENLAESNVSLTTSPLPIATNFTATNFEASTTHATMLNALEVSATEPSFENNTTKIVSNIMSPQLREMNISDSFGKNESYKDEINISLSNETFSEKPVLELIIKNSEAEELVSQLKSMPIIIKAIEPHNISLSISNETDEKNGRNTNMTPNDNFNESLNNSKADMLNTQEKLLTVEVI